MNWYKISKIETFQDRNDLNRRIKYFKEAIIRLGYLKKYIYQNAPHAKKVMLEMANNKIMSSFPNFKQIMLDASEIALDSYIKFSQICDIIIDKLMSKIQDFEKERNEFTNEYLPNKIKEMKSNDE